MEPLVIGYFSDFLRLEEKNITNNNDEKLKKKCNGSCCYQSVKKSCGRHYLV